MLFKRVGEKKGIALIMAMWIMTMLLVVAASFAFMMRTEIKMGINFGDEIQAHYLARAGVEKAIALLRNDGGTTDHLGEDWYTGGATGYTNVFLGRGTYRVTVLDESGMVNLNLADDLVAKIGSADSNSESLGGYDGSGLIDVGTVKAAAIKTYRSGKKFDTIRELVKVANIGETIVNNNLDNMTVYTTSDLVNINTAPYYVLRGLSDGDATDGLSGDEVNNIITNRPPTPLKTPVPANPSYTDLTTRFTGASGINEGEARYLTNQAPALPSVNQVRGDSEGYFKIRSTGYIPNAITPVAQRKIEVVVYRVPPIQIKYWSEHMD